MPGNSPQEGRIVWYKKEWCMILPLVHSVLHSVLHSSYHCFVIGDREGGYIIQSPEILIRADGGGVGVFASGSIIIIVSTH